MTSDSAGAFELLSDETRVGIVQALVEHRSDHPTDPGLPFATLREQVGMRDSGQFNYHLDRLRGHFVEKDGDEYRLTYAGQKIAGTIISGDFDPADVAAAADVDGSCLLCDEPLSVTYEEGWLSVACDDGHQQFHTGVPPKLVEDRPLPEALSLATRIGNQQLELATEGLCPFCYGEMTSEVVEAGQTDEHRYTLAMRCGECGTQVTATVGARLLGDLTARTFYADHGRDLRTEPPWQVELLRPDAVSEASTEPLELRVAVELDGERLTGTVDADGDLLAVDREPVD